VNSPQVFIKTKFLVLMALLVLEAAGASQPRRWTSSDGVRVTGVFVALHGSVLALKEVGGRNVFWSWAQVSAGDRAYLAREYGVLGPPSARPQPAAPPRQQIVTDRIAKVAQRAEPAKAPPDDATAQPAAAPANEP
jgi:hypothetical protein